MKKDDLSKLIQNPKLIPGIYNYCDRWCERCAFTERCLSFAMEQEEKKAKASAKPTSPSKLKETTRQEAQSSLRLAKELLEQMAKEQGITFDPAELQALGLEQERRQSAADRHPLAEAAVAYSQMVDQWFQQGENALREKEQEVLTQAKLGVTKIKEEVARLTDAVQILRWYQHLLPSKLRRALQKIDHQFSQVPGEVDGSVKVALIAIDRSIAAWLRMKDFFPQHSDPILSLLVHLDRLRRAAESEFPNARKFVRPGFDETA